MAQRTVELSVQIVRCGCMRRMLMADRAVVSRCDVGAEMTPGAVAVGPVARMAPRRCLIVAADAEILLVASEAALPVTFGHEAVAPRAPGVRMVARRLCVVA